MSLYRLDLSYPDGRLVPVSEPVIGGDFLTSSRGYARYTARVAFASHAINSAHETPTAVVCTRIYGAGSMRESFRVTA